MNLLRIGVIADSQFISSSAAPPAGVLTLSASLIVDGSAAVALGNASGIFLNGASVTGSYLEAFGADKGISYRSASNLGASSDTGAIRFVINTASSLQNEQLCDLSASDSNNSRLSFRFNSGGLTPTAWNTIGGQGSTGAMGPSTSAVLSINTDHEIEINFHNVNGSSIGCWFFVDGVFHGQRLAFSGNIQRDQDQLDFINLGVTRTGSGGSNRKFRNLKYFNDIQHSNSAACNYTPDF